MEFSVFTWYMYVNPWVMIIAIIGFTIAVLAYYTS